MHIFFVEFNFLKIIIFQLDNRTCFSIKVIKGITHLQISYTTDNIAKNNNILLSLFILYSYLKNVIITRLVGTVALCVATVSMAKVAITWTEVAQMDATPGGLIECVIKVKFYCYIK